MARSDLSATTFASNVWKWAHSPGYSIHDLLRMIQARDKQRDAETSRAAIELAAGWHDNRARQAERDGNGAMAYRHRFYASEIRSAASADSRKVGEDG